jgi:hypothetical protein
MQVDRKMVKLAPGMAVSPRAPSFPDVQLHI